MKGRVLIVAGSDSGGGAGIQADIKTVTALGGYASTAVTAVTVQDTQRVHEVYPMSPALIRRQIEIVASDIGADAVKIGMIGTAENAEAVLQGLAGLEGIPLIVDPVLVATSGDSLGAEGVVSALKERLVPKAAIVTANLPELRALTQMPVDTDTQIVEAASALLRTGPAAVLAKGGHAGGEVVRDHLLQPGEYDVFEGPRIQTTSTHGTGCTLASAIAAGYAQGLCVYDAVDRAIRFVRAAISSAPGYGRGAGPLDHTVWIDEPA